MRSLSHRRDHVFGFPGLEVVVGNHELSHPRNHAINTRLLSIGGRPGLRISHESDRARRNALQLIKGPGENKFETVGERGRAASFWKIPCQLRKICGELIPMIHGEI